MSKKITQDEFEKRIKFRFPEENFSIIEYESLGKPAIIKCNVCNKEINVNKANNFLAPTKAYGCVNCHGQWRNREKKLNLLKEKYDIIDTQIKETHTYYTVKCKKCEHIRTSTLHNLIKNLDCGCVTNVYRNRSAEEVIKKINENSKVGDYELISEYQNQTTKILLKHKTCGFIWSVRPADVINGREKCPKCGKKESYGVRLITDILKEFNISFDKEHQLKNSLQKFDFYFEINNKKIAIEYNGKQHYEEVKFFQSSLAQQKERDARKRQYCLCNNIQLIEIPYWKKDNEIKDILLEQIGSTTILDGVESSDSK